MAEFPIVRPRRLRQNPGIRSLVRETRIQIERLIYPMFVVPGNNLAEEISAMPGIFRYSPDRLVEEVRQVVDLGIGSILLFGTPREKTSDAREAWSSDGIVSEALRLLRHNFPNLYIITDVCLCAYTQHGHCGLISEGTVLNDESLIPLAKTAVAHAQAGADMVAPSDMMDGRVAKIRQALDKNGFQHIPVMSYSVKYASAFYGPFREAAGSSPEFGDRSSYQMDPANREEALREAVQDIQEGADILMVKPALAYLDIIRDLKETFNYPVAAYNVSAEYSMIKAAAAAGWIDEKRAAEEVVTSILRAGADIVITYFAKDLAQSAREGRY